MRSSILRALLMMTMLGACATGSSAPSSDYCRIYEPITWGAGDSAETVAQITRENAKYLCVCKADCPQG